MKRTIVLAVLAVLGLSVALSALSEESKSDSPTLQAILSELRAMHKDMRATAISQILLTELQTQQTAVNAAAAHANSARLELTNMQATERAMSVELADTQDKLTNATDPAQKQQLSDRVHEFTSQLSAARITEEGLSTNLQIAENQLRSAQDVMDDIQKRLDETIKRLQPTADVP